MWCKNIIYLFSWIFPVSLSEILFYSQRSPSWASVSWGSGWMRRAWCTLGNGCGGSCRTGVRIYQAGSRRCKRPALLPLSDDLNPLARAAGISMQSIWRVSACNTCFLNLMWKLCMCEGLTLAVSVEVQHAAGAHHGLQRDDLI